MQCLKSLGFVMRSRNHGRNCYTRDVRKVSFILVLLFLVFFGGLGLVGWYLAPNDELQQADAIIAISGGDTKARTDEASSLYLRGWAPRLIVAGAASDPESPSNATVMRRIAVSQGVPESAITVEDYSRDTNENANKVAELFAEKPAKVILVTSPYHQRRASFEFEKVLPDTEIINHSAFDQTWRRSLWWITPKGWYLTISESVKLIFLKVNGS